MILRVSMSLFSFWVCMGFVSLCGFVGLRLLEFVDLWVCFSTAASKLNFCQTMYVRLPSPNWKLFHIQSPSSTQNQSRTAQPTTSANNSMLFVS